MTFTTTNLNLSPEEHRYLKAYTRWTLGLRSTAPPEPFTADTDAIESSVEFMLRGMPTRGGDGVG